MTMIECRECKQAVSDEAKACPHCGADPRAKKPVASWSLRLLAALVIAVLLFVVSGYYVGKRSSDDAINRASARMAELGHPEASVAVSKYTTRGSTTYTCLSAYYKEGEEDRVRLFVVLQAGALLDFLGMHEEGEKTFNATYSDVCL